MDWIYWLLAFVGHLGLWSSIFNRIHATAYPRKVRKASEKLILALVGFPLLWVLALMMLRRTTDWEEFVMFPVTRVYLYGCVLLGAFFTARWIWRKFTLRLPQAVIETSRQRINVASELKLPIFEGSISQLLGMLPFNEASQLTIERMTLQLDVDPKLDGLRICQLSDLHFTGQISLDYFEYVIEQANRLDPDLVIVTGDLVDVATCLGWLDKTLGRLQAPLGVFYVLGNHDQRIGNETLLRQRLEQLGIRQAAGAWHVVEYQGASIQLTGNELPWFPAVDELAADQPPADLNILLSHSPDQLDWAKTKRFDLMFAGHTHGGQIAFPIIGPVVAPSKYGVLYASGTFQIGDMLMHVSRGISGDEPIRVNSPPEVGLFTIRSSR